MLPVVAIEVQSFAERPEQHVAEMLSACTRALSDTVCSLSVAGEAQAPSAVVTWTSDTAVTIEVGGALVPRSEWTRRNLLFDPADETSERWRSVGLTTALMLGDRPASAPASQPGWFQVNALVLAGTGLANGARSGAGVGAGVQAFETPVWFAARFDYTTARREPPKIELSWLTLGLGLDAQFDLAPGLGLDVGVAGLAQHVTVSAGQRDRSDEASQWVPGGRLRLGVVWPVSRHWAGVVSTEGELLDASTEILHQGQSIANIPRISVLLGLGFRYRP